MAICDRQLGPRQVMAPAMRRAHDSRHNLVRHFQPYQNRRNIGRDADDLAVGQPPLGRIGGVYQQRAAFLAFRQDIEIVHPTIIGAHVPATDEQELIRGAFGIPFAEQVINVRNNTFGSKVDHPIGCRKQPGQLRLHCTKIDAFGRFGDTGHCQSVRNLSERVSIRPGSNQDVEETIRAPDVPEHLAGLRQVDRSAFRILTLGDEFFQPARDELFLHLLCRNPLEPRDELQEDVPVVLLPFLQREDRGRPLGDLPNHERDVEEVEV